MASKVLVEIAGGLGNQMFQYAFYLKLKSCGYNAKLYYDQRQQLHNGFELENIFNLNIKFVNESEINFLLDKSQTLFSKVKRKLLGNNPSFYWEHDKGYEYKPEILNPLKSIYLQGCWLSEKYFFDISKQIKEAFTFVDIQLNAENCLVYESIIDNAASVSVHIRRGDYLKSKVNLNIAYDVYLKECFDYIKQKILNPYFFIFSDDTDFVRELLAKLNFDPNKYCIVDNNKGSQSYIDMYFMTLCKHNIITNSTFSWWGAWLNENDAKIVISPKHWFTTTELNKNSIIPDSWIKI
jgi:Glycosyl transferase family 11